VADEEAQLPKGTSIRKGEAEAPTRDDSSEVAEGGGPAYQEEGPVAKVTSVPPHRTPGVRLGSVLDRGVWTWVWVIGAIVLLVLIIVAVSQMPSNPKKGMGAGTVVENAEVAVPWTGITGTHSAHL